MKTLQMSVGRDYETATRYEFVLYDDDRVIARAGGFASRHQAAKGGRWKAQQLLNGGRA
jgi:hypothetical protein